MSIIHFRFRYVLCFLAFHFVFGLAAQAQSGGNYTITQTIVADGGGASASGNYKVEGTIGQADTGARSNGKFSFGGGFWGTGLFGVCPTITLAPIMLPQGTVSIPYSQTLTAGPLVGSYTYSLSSENLPTGITLTNAGLLSGIPLQAGSFPLTITAKDANGCLGSGVYTLVIGNPIPNLTVLNPATTFTGNPAFTLIVNGSNFVAGAIAKWNGQDRPTAFINSTKLSVTIIAADLAVAGTVQLVVFNPGPGGGYSNEVIFTILEHLSYEGDVSTRPNGDGLLTIADWVQAGRFVVGLDTPAPGSEFQRADSAPRASLGNGKITVADWVQAGRYALGVDPVVAAGGPVIPAAPLTEAPNTSPEMARAVRANNSIFQRGEVGLISIEVDAQGNEMALAFTLNFDPQRMNFVDASIRNGVQGAALVVNATQSINGKIGIALAWPLGQSFVAGTQSLLTLRFIPTGGESNVTSTVSFSDQLVTREIADVNGVALPGITYTSATVNVTGRAVATVSAANYVGVEQAVESIVSAFSSQLSAVTQAALSLPLPISLGGSQIVVRDGNDVERNAPLFYVSPTQINFQIPKDTAEGIAAIKVFSGSGAISLGLLTIGKVAPAFFSADSSGTGYAAGSTLLVHADGSRVDNNLVRYDSTTAKFLAIPIDLGIASDQVYLTLYGTGIKNRTDLASVKVTIGGVAVAVEYAGEQGFFAGLDQVNLKLPSSLKGKGEVNVELEIQQRVANVVKINVK